MKRRHAPVEACSQPPKRTEPLQELEEHKTHHGTTGITPVDIYSIICEMKQIEKIMNTLDGEMREVRKQNVLVNDMLQIILDRKNVTNHLYSIGQHTESQLVNDGNQV
jgi:hypothetical protein